MPIVRSFLHGTTNILYFNRKYEWILKPNAIKRMCYGYHACNQKTQTLPQSGPWNVLFFGTDDFAVESLRSLYSKYRCNVLHRLEVVTGNKGKENAVSKYAKQNGLVINTWPIQNKVTNFHIGVVVSFGHLIPSHVIDSFPLGMINVHGSLLPRWRGAAPIIYSLMNGDQETGITLMKIMPKKFDIGAIVAQKKVDIGPHETMPELYIKLAKLGADVLAETMENLQQALITTKPQIEENVTYAPKITSKISLIRWNEMSAKNVYDLQRALSGLYPLTTKFKDKTIKLFDICEIEKPTNAGKFEDEAPGVVSFDKQSNVLAVKCKNGTWISVKRIIVSGRPPMNARDFCNGFLSGKHKARIHFC